MEKQESIRLKIKRQDKPETGFYWQNFEIPYHIFSNVISCLQEIQRNPVTREGKAVQPVVWDC